MTIYRVAPAELAPWRNATALAMETRLDRARFAALVLAAESYLHDGRPPAALTPAEVYKLGLMPPGWIVVPKKTEPPWDEGGMNLPRHPSDPHQLDDLWLARRRAGPYRGRRHWLVSGAARGAEASIAPTRSALCRATWTQPARGKEERPSGTACDELQRRRPRARRARARSEDSCDGVRRRVAANAHRDGVEHAARRRRRRRMRRDGAAVSPRFSSTWSLDALFRPRAWRRPVLVLLRQRPRPAAVDLVPGLVGARFEPIASTRSSRMPFGRRAASTSHGRPTSRSRRG